MIDRTSLLELIVNLEIKLQKTEQEKEDWKQAFLSLQKEANANVCGVQTDPVCTGMPE